MGCILAHWLTNIDADTLTVVQGTIARILINVWEQNDSWVALAARVFGLPEGDLWDNMALGADSVLLAHLIHVTRQCLPSHYFNWMVLEALSKPNIRNTLAKLQHDFCTLWNETVQEARKQGPCTAPVYILKKGSVISISLYIQALLSLLSTMTTTSCTSPRHTQSATFPPIAQTRPLTILFLSPHPPIPRLTQY